MGRRWFVLWVVAALCLCLGVPVQAESDVLQAIYPRHLADQDVRQANGFAMVALALEHSGADFKLALSDAPMSRRRLELELKRGDLINVVMLPDAPTYDEAYLKVDFSVDKGLLGQRVHLVSEQSLDAFSGVTTMDELKTMTGCTGSAWRITKQWEAHGFKLLKIENYEELFIHLARGSCDYVSRGVMEILPEWDAYHDRYPNLRIEPNLLVQTPLRNVIYVSPNAPDLRDALSRGLTEAEDSGAFDALFEQLYGDRLRALNLGQRRVLTLGDPPPAP
ncbi:hypothetical protein [Saccharospirillum salsuginis]|uniref:Uncharacterized protein n=1 Tax=Saccharospirillum salsuginis TaxID=418750 RepID=A0A918K584_9GAMM|nr:hypothetical protein [Saccharospirillum salsuginis]GGX48771.1 hypothetical protein GCM10007392_14900 [Saccharospirillum salsuginis]